MLEKLKIWRLKTAKEKKLSPAYVFHDKHLKNIVKSKPSNIDELLNVKSVGERKAELYGINIF